MFSIIIPTWNNLAYLQWVVESIRRNSTHEHQIIVHVNDGSDGTLAWVRNEGIEHTASPANIGICHAVNLAAARATRDYVVYMNDDMYCCPGWDDALARRIPQMPSDLFMLSGTMIEPRGNSNAPTGAVPPGHRRWSIATGGTRSAATAANSAPG